LASRFQRAPLDLAEQLVGGLGLGDGGLSAQAESPFGVDLLDSLVDFGVKSAERERGDAAHGGKVAAAPSQVFEP
jgi:hypothetical protein